MRVYLLALNMVLGILIPLGIQLADRRRLSPEEREWVWNGASWGSALYNFGPLSLVAWGYVTRSPRHWWGLLQGVTLAEIALLVQAAINEGIGRALALSPRHLGETREGFLATGLVVIVLAVVIGAGRSVHDAVRGTRAAPDAGSRNEGA